MEASKYNDFEFAKRVWTEAESKADFTAAREAVCPTGSVGDLWIDRYYWPNMRYPDFEEFHKRMLDHPQTALLQPCWDLLLAGEEWTLIYRVWSRTIDGSNITDHIPDATWNTGLINQDPYWCELIAGLNIFTGRCDDLPDWRTLEMRKDNEIRALYQQLPLPSKSDEYETSGEKWNYAENEINKRFAAEEANSE